MPHVYATYVAEEICLKIEQTYHLFKSFNENYGGCMHILLCNPNFIDNRIIGILV